MVLQWIGAELFPHLVAHLVIDAGREQVRRLRARPTRPARQTRRRPASPPADVLRDAGFRVVSTTPGCARLAVAGVRGNPERAAEVADALERLPGIRAVTASAWTGTGLVHYDPTLTDLAAILRAGGPSQAPPTTSAA